MIPFDENLRYTHYPLNENSVVIDCGSFEGKFARLISERYNCRVLAFEPISAFFENCKRNLAPHPKVRLDNVGVGAENTDAIWKIKGDMTGQASGGEVSERVKIRDIVDVLEKVGGEVDVLKINIEGAEYAVIGRLLDSSFIHGIANLQVQWHSVVPGFKQIREGLEAQLFKTHERSWERGDFDNGWDNFRRK